MYFYMCMAISKLNFVCSKFIPGILSFLAFYQTPLTQVFRNCTKSIWEKCTLWMASTWADDLNTHGDSASEH